MSGSDEMKPAAVKTPSKRGRLFDWLVLLVAVAVVLGITYRVTGGALGIGVEPKEEVRVSITLLVSVREAAMLDAIRVGDRLSEGKTDLDATVTAVRRVQATEMVVVDDDGTVLATPERAEARVTIEAGAVRDGTMLSFGGQQVGVGRRVFLESLLYKISGTVLDVSS